MKEVNDLKNEMRAEYDFASMSGGVRGKYVERLRRESNIVVLEPEVAAAFPTGDPSRFVRLSVSYASHYIDAADPPFVTRFDKKVSHLPG